MPKISARLVLSWRGIAVLTAFFLAVQRLTGGALFQPVENAWTLTEDLKNMKRPSYGNVSAGATGLSPAGTVIGVGGPGFGQWNFSAPGPLPSGVQPYFLPGEGAPSGVYLLTGAGERIPLCENLPLRDRAIDFQDKIAGLRSFSVRFEGRNALLSGVKFRQPLVSGIPAGGLALALFCLSLIFCRGVALREPRTAVLALLTAAGFLMRWGTLCNYWNVPLEGDSAGYWGLARSLSLSNPFANAHREPGLIWTLRLAKTLFGDSERSARFLSLLLSCSLIPLTWLLGRRARLGTAACLMAAGLAAFNPFSVFMAAQGSQLELFTFLILIFSALWLDDRAGAAGTAGAALMLTRIQSAASVFPLGLLAAWRSRRGTRRAMPYFVLPALALGVMLATARMNTGSFTGNLDHAARYYTAAETTGDPEALSGTEGMTLGKYLFSGRALPRLALKTLNGWFRILFDPFNPFNRIFLNSHYSRAWNLLLLPFFWAGLWFFLADGERRYFLWLPLLFLNALPALQDQFREPRLLFHAAPFFFLLCAAGITFAAAKLVSLSRWK